MHRHHESETLASGSQRSSRNLANTMASRGDLDAASDLFQSVTATTTEGGKLSEQPDHQRNSEQPDHQRAKTNLMAILEAK